MDNSPVPTESLIENYRSLSEEERRDIIVKQILASFPGRENDCAFPWNPTVSSSSIGSWSLQPQAPPGDRVGKLHWCSCQGCIEMPTQKESTCCREIQEVQGHIPEGGKCITEAEMFRKLFGTELHVRLIAIVLHNKDGPHFVDPYNNRRLRKTAYRTFVAWIYVSLGKKIGVVPSCAVKVVRELFPDPDGKYVNFIYSDDYDASEMALH
ncbi:P2X purinoceptor 7-like isoform X1 [Rana temporaria]|uniref:P2X purinoceptor 7-like isoform X1 n=1 Tax=Rana temporaria TaxID=8407 RepID=UPI001AACAB0B|nr:P2X purinoceptor 7-like isoform X1 [Rana temporaria]XP_040203031.1 P2X purinoceptor 7-like isoform X1 [Rana temporaria]XP_040203033.1 P2X purinoceptor 7-like isoform X1 [Rana temporaria]XP_040203034.1 P2X purinoceptor 7-like isoform X1 [Rana temporaria]